MNYRSAASVAFKTTVAATCHARRRAWVGGEITLCTTLIHIERSVFVLAQRVDMLTQMRPAVQLSGTVNEMDEPEAASHL